MRHMKLFLACACITLLPMCNQVEGPLPAGSVQATDVKADALLRKAEKLLAEGRLRRAESTLDDIVQRHSLSPAAPKAHLMLGEIMERRNSPRDAFKQYGKIVERYQDSELYATALNRQLAIATSAAKGKPMGKVLWMISVPMESGVVIDWLRSVINNAPYADMSATAYVVLGEYLLKQKKYEEAIGVYMKLVENYPDSKYAPSAQMMVAQLWAASRLRGNQNLVNLDKAREAYEEFTLRFPDHADASKARAGAAQMQRYLVEQELEVGRYYLERAHEYGSAQFCFENVIRQKEQNPEAAVVAQRLLELAKERKSMPARRF